MHLATRPTADAKFWKTRNRDMTMNTTNLFGAKLMATFFALVLSGAMVLASVGPAYNVPATQDLIA